MAGLNDLLSNTEKSQVTLPSWYTTAQQDVANQAKTAASAVPAFSATPGAGAVAEMMSPNNVFNQGQNALSTIASGAANPWMQSATGQTVGNPNTAMGGLFNAQTDYLNQIMPNVTAAPTAASIGSGQFGSLRGMTAAQKARGDAFSDLAQKQMTAALQNQQTGVSAGTGLGQTGLQESQAATGLTDLQQKYPFAGSLNYGNIINAMKVPETRETQTQMSPLNQAGSLLSIVNGTAGTSTTPGTPGLISGVGGLVTGVKDLYGGLSDWWNSGSGTTTTGEADTSWADVWGDTY
jgi:hypothetical protein